MHITEEAIHNRMRQRQSQVQNPAHINIEDAVCVAYELLIEEVSLRNNNILYILNQHGHGGESMSCMGCGDIVKKLLSKEL